MTMASLQRLGGKSWPPTARPDKTRHTPRKGAMQRARAVPLARRCPSSPARGPSLADAKAREDAAEQIFGCDGAGDLTEMLLGLAQILSEQLRRMVWQ